MAERHGGSNALNVALIAMLTVPAGAPLGYGPTSLGVANQKPFVRLPGRRACTTRLAAGAGGAGAGPGRRCSGRSRTSTGSEAVAATETDDASVGMNHSGEPTTSGRASPDAWENGASVDGLRRVQARVDVEVLRLLAVVGDGHRDRHRLARRPAWWPRCLGMPGASP